MGSENSGPNGGGANVDDESVPEESGVGGDWPGLNVLAGKVFYRVGLERTSPAFCLLA